MQQPFFDSGIKMGTLSGTLLIIFMNIQQQDMLKTAVMAAIGAIVSFGVSLLLKVIFKRRRR